MKDTALYEHLPGLKSPWSVMSVDLSLAEQRVVVDVVFKQGQVWADPPWIVQAHVLQLKYSDGKVEELAVPWAERYSRVTLLIKITVKTMNPSHSIWSTTRL